jgi:hypothetical protein
MTAGHLPERDGADVEALIADRYLEALMSAVDRHADDAPADASLDPGVRDAARSLRRALIRVHPSFRFEERLASRLADLPRRRPPARRRRHPPFAPAPGRARWCRPVGDPLLAPILAGTVDPADSALDPDARPTGIRRPLIVRGAITSAAISLVGVAWVAWRTTRPGARSSASAMARAGQAAHARRLAAETLAAAGGLSGGGGPA